MLTFPSYLGRYAFRLLLLSMKKLAKNFLQNVGLLSQLIPNPFYLGILIKPELAEIIVLNKNMDE